MRIIKYFQGMTFNRKITTFLIAVILLTSNIVLFTTTISAGKTITSKSGELATKQIELISRNLKNRLEDFNDICQIAIANNAIQDYLKSEFNVAGDYGVSSKAYDALTSIFNLKSDIGYIALMKYNTDNFILIGNKKIMADFRGVILKDYGVSNRISSNNMTYSISQNVSFDNKYSTNIYQPIYDKFKLNREIGLLCINLEADRLKAYYDVYDSSIPFNIYLTDHNGKVFSQSGSAEISPGAQHFEGKKGSFRENNKMIIYNYIDAWDWYVVGEIPLEYLLKDSYTTFALLSVMVMAICALSIYICSRLSNSLYKPLEEITERMDAVSLGDLQTRMTGDYNGRDFKKLTDGFNKMVREIDSLMEKVKTEQHQIEQIELNALQSQIKPHFLYNTLECIHWQAVVDGSTNVSVMVKALANYYRLCLSKGQEIIPLSQEISHVRNYLIIQNMRYGDIVESDIEFEDRFSQVLLPKMTLQPLVENAIYHGIRTDERVTGKIVIRALQSEGKVIIRVSDNGKGLTQQKIDEINAGMSEHDESFGYGIRNVHKRIEILFGQGYGLHFEKNESGGVTVNIIVPG